MAALSITLSVFHLTLGGSTNILIVLTANKKTSGRYVYTIRRNHCMILVNIYTSGSISVEKKWILRQRDAPTDRRVDRQPYLIKAPFGAL